MKRRESLIKAGWRAIAVTALLATLIPCGGCRICADCEDLAYPTYGGVWQRTRRDAGRVGSVFDPGGARASDLVSRDVPPTPDELDRQRGDNLSDLFDQDGMEKGDEPREDDRPDFERREEELRQRQLEDIEGENEDELRQRRLDDI